MIRLALLLTACGPVAPEVEPTPAEVIASHAVAAAIRVEACRATLPPMGAPPLHRIVWAIVCAPAPGVTPAPLSAMVPADGR